MTAPGKKPERFFETRILADERVLICRPRGSVDLTLAEQLVAFVERTEMAEAAPFHRFADLRDVGAVTLTYEDMGRLTERRRRFRPEGPPVKAALLATSALVFGMARMYEALLGSDRIEVQVFRTLEEAAGWLGVAPDKLAPA